MDGDTLTDITPATIRLHYIQLVGQCLELSAWQTCINKITVFWDVKL